MERNDADTSWMRSPEAWEIPQNSRIYYNGREFAGRWREKLSFTEKNTTAREPKRTRLPDQEPWETWKSKRGGKNRGAAAIEATLSGNRRHEAI